MITTLLRKYSDKFLSRWIVLSYDSFVVYISFLLSVLLYQNFRFIPLMPISLLGQSALVLCTYLLGFLIFRSHAGIIRFTGIDDAFRVFRATGAAFLILLTFGWLGEPFPAFADLVPPVSVIIVHFLLSLFVLVASRFIIRSIYGIIIRTERKNKFGVAIYGAGAAGMITRSALLKDRFKNYEIRCFIDDNHYKLNKNLYGIPVLSADKVLTDDFIQRHDLRQLIIAIQKLDVNHRKEIIERGLELNLEVKVVPPIDNWINGQLSTGQLQKVKIEELLEREPIRLDNQNVRQDIRAKVVLVTGAAGSIGSEIARQILQYEPARLILVDQAESPLYELQFELNNTQPYKKQAHKVLSIITSVNDRSRMERIFNAYQPDIVYHAAAYKHVPLMEDHPYEAVRVNVLGTRQLADLALKYRTRKFVMVSTDKAVNPTNVMGASKRIAEIYVQPLSNEHTQFITTRFGNVLGSNGSVIPLFRKQIEQGGPVTVTHRDITRFFMTIPEACNLVLEAGAMGKGGEIFVFDMGEPVRIYDLARKMIQLSGLQVDKDIRIEEVGLRPGEKLFEELLADQENTLPTHHPKIMKARTRRYKKERVDRLFGELHQLLYSGSDTDLVKKMKEIVPEFRSNNSIYTALDESKSKGGDRSKDETTLVKTGQHK